MSASLTTGSSQSSGFVAPRIAALRQTPYGRGALYVASTGLIALAYYLAGRAGLELAYLDGAVAALWPPAGLGLAVLVLWGLRFWPGVVIGDLFLADLSTPAAT